MIAGDRASAVPRPPTDQPVTAGDRASAVPRRAAGPPVNAGDRASAVPRQPSDQPVNAGHREPAEPRRPTGPPVNAGDRESAVPRPTGATVIAGDRESVVPRPAGRSVIAGDRESVAPRRRTGPPAVAGDGPAANAPTPTEPFEARYRADPDPWHTLTDPYESHKRAQTLAACGPGPFASAVDLGAGTGVLAAELAPRCKRLLALDGAPTAVAEAQRRLAPFPHAEARTAMLPDGLPRDRPLDLVVASEILYYLDDAAFHTTLAWLSHVLAPGGRCVAVHWTGRARDLRRSADAVGAALAATPRLERHATPRTDGFRLDLLERAR
jgi:protein-L-isoaspartate O-methyltransferase